MEKAVGDRGRRRRRRRMGRKSGLMVYSFLTNGRFIPSVLSRDKTFTI